MTWEIGDYFIKYYDDTSYIVGVIINKSYVEEIYRCKILVKWETGYKVGHTYLISLSNVDMNIKKLKPSEIQPYINLIQL